MLCEEIGVKLNSRERIKKVLNHKIPDRIPIDLGSMRSTGIATIAYNKLRKKLGIKSGLAKMYDFVQQLAYPEKGVMDIFHIDVIDAGQAFLESENNWRKFKLNDGSECLVNKLLNIEIDSYGTVLVKDNDGLVLGKKPKSSLYTDQSYWVYQNIPKIPDVIREKDLNHHIWSDPTPPWHLDIFSDKQFAIFVNSIRDFYYNTNYATSLSLGCSLVEGGMVHRGMENWLCDTYLDKKGVNRLLDKLMNGYLASIKKILKGVGEYIDILVFSDDMGGQDGPFMSPDIYRELFKPRHKQMWDFVHNNSNCKVFLHSCGSIYELIPDLIDAGVDILNPVQTTAKNMEPERLKKEFGKDIIFWGGCCNTRDILAKGSPKDVEEDVKKRIAVLGRNGGLVFNQIHNILADVPPENIIAMFEAAIKYGQY